MNRGSRGNKHGRMNKDNGRNKDRIVKRVEVEERGQKASGKRR